jgi:hypothetical protein
VEVNITAWWLRLADIYQYFLGRRRFAINVLLTFVVHELLEIFYKNDLRGDSDSRR